MRLIKHLRALPAIARHLLAASRRFDKVERDLELVREALGRIEGRQLFPPREPTLSGSEFRVFSQYGEDGIIYFLLRTVPVRNRVFVEFGADAYNDESNTRFLLTTENWSGLIIDGDERNVERLKGTFVYALHDIRAARAFITRENINGLLRDNGVTGEIGILSVDIDGNDYWVWEAIDAVTPAIVVVEYNHRFGPDDAVVVPYREDFARMAAHGSGLYYGASLAALHALGARKGYALVGCNDMGTNAFFVRRDLLPPGLPALTPAEAYRVGRYSEYLLRDGVRGKLSPKEESDALRRLDLPLVRVDKQ